tara:strand:- start:1628 stop:1936 length:309 start_codon:yes stop_codon:yes gene_type:complete
MADKDLQEQETQGPEPIELQWEEVQEIFEGQLEIQKLDRYLGALLVETEKKKLQLLSTIEEIRAGMMQQAEVVRSSKNIDPLETYELKMPNKAGEKGFLIKK